MTCFKVSGCPGSDHLKKTSLFLSEAKIGPVKTWMDGGVFYSVSVKLGYPCGGVVDGPWKIQESRSCSVSSRGLSALNASIAQGCDCMSRAFFSRPCL